MHSHSQSITKVTALYLMAVPLAFPLFLLAKSSVSLLPGEKYNNWTYLENLKVNIIKNREIRGKSNLQWNWLLVFLLTVKNWRFNFGCPLKISSVLVSFPNLYACKAKFRFVLWEKFAGRLSWCDTLETHYDLRYQLSSFRKLPLIS